MSAGQLNLAACAARGGPPGHFGRDCAQSADEYHPLRCRRYE